MEIKYSHRLFRTPLSLDLPEVTPEDLKPAFLIKKPCVKDVTIFLYAGNLWAEFPYMSLREFIRDVKSVGKPSCDGMTAGDLREVLEEKLSGKLVSDQTLYFQVCEPRFYYESHNHCIRECHEPNEVEMVSTRRFFRADETDLAQGYARTINEMIFSQPIEQIFKTPEIVILDQSAVNLSSGAIKHDRFEG